MNDILQESIQETDGDQYVIVCNNEVVAFPDSVRTFVQACKYQESHLQHTVGEDFLTLRLKAFRGIQDTIRSLQHCTSSFAPESVWLGFGGMNEWVQIAGFFDPKEGDAFECAVDALEGRGQTPMWVYNLDAACRIFLRDPQNVSLG